MRVTIPTSLKDISLSQYQTYLRELENNKDESDDYFRIKRLQIFCQLTYEQVLNIQYGSITEISNKIDEVLNSKNDYIERFTIDGINFGWLPKLDDMSYGEFLDLNNNISDWENMHVAMGVLYRPIIKELQNKYAIEPYGGDKYHEQLKHIKMDCVVGAMVFFWNLGMDLGIATANYLEEEMSKMSFQQQLTLVESGVGMQQLTTSLTEILQKMKQ
jgi:hypothetical protein